MYQLTINVSSAEELAAVAAKLSGQAGAVPIQHQPTMQQYQAVQQSPAVPQQPPTQPPIAPQQYQTGQAPTAPIQPATTGQAPTQPPVQQTSQAPTAPTAAAPTYTAQQLGVAAQPIVDAGRGGELVAWLNQKGAGALTQLDPQYYGEFATYLRSLGCQI